MSYPSWQFPRFYKGPFIYQVILCGGLGRSWGPSVSSRLGKTLIEQARKPRSYASLKLRLTHLLTKNSVLANSVSAERNEVRLLLPFGLSRGCEQVHLAHKVCCNPDRECRRADERKVKIVEKTNEGSSKCLFFSGEHCFN